jgi:hypothetical protein
VQTICSSANKSYDNSEVAAGVHRLCLIWVDLGGVTSSSWMMGVTLFSLLMKCLCAMRAPSERGTTTTTTTNNNNKQIYFPGSAAEERESDSTGSSGWCRLLQYSQPFERFVAKTMGCANVR